MAGNFAGHSARMGYRLGLLERWGDYEETRDRARIDLHLQKWDGKEDFSKYLTEKLPKRLDDYRSIITRSSPETLLTSIVSA